MPERAAAQTVTTFISNTGQVSTFESDQVFATSFTTGTGTYTVSDVGIHLRDAPTGSTVPLVRIYEDTGGSPGTLVATMINPGTFQAGAVNIFTAPAGTTPRSASRLWSDWPGKGFTTR